MHTSISTIDNPEFINLQPSDISPLMSKCEIKVLYIGQNRNRSFISKEVALEMSKTLRGAPIVGYYRKDINDFGDHGEKITIQNGEMTFECLTMPYGFVDPSAQVWFKTFDDEDDFGNITTREYLMTTGYLWTGQFEEAAMALENGKPHSMELDDATVKGQWSTDTKSGIEFFIINDATFSKLCILGDDVEPCFEGSSITKPNISASFSKTVDNNFKNTLFSMMQELKQALEGGKPMEGNQNEVVESTNYNLEDAPVAETEETVVTTEFEENEVTTELPATEFEEGGDSTDGADADADAQDEGDPEAADGEETTEPEVVEEDETMSSTRKQEFAMIEELQAKFEALEKECESLRTYKEQVELDKINLEKDSLINKFTILSEQTREKYSAEKSNYKLDELETLLYAEVGKTVFNCNEPIDNSVNNNVEENNPVTTLYCLDNTKASGLPAWLEAVREIRDNK